MFIDEIESTLNLSDSDMSVIIGTTCPANVTNWRKGKNISSTFQTKLDILHRSIKDKESLEIIKQIFKNKNKFIILGSLLFIGSNMKTSKSETKITETVLEDGSIVQRKETIITPINIKTIINSTTVTEMKNIINWSKRNAAI